MSRRRRHDHAEPPRRGERHRPRPRPRSPPRPSSPSNAISLCGSSCSGGEQFCVGGDLRSFGQCENLPAELREVTTTCTPRSWRLPGSDAPIVVAVHGSAAGAGLGLACGGDIVIAADNARFVVACTRVGLNPDGGTSWFLPRARRATHRAGADVDQPRPRCRGRTRRWHRRRASCSPTGRGRGGRVAAELAAGPRRTRSAKRSASCGRASTRRSRCTSKPRPPPSCARRVGPTRSRASPRSSRSARPTSPDRAPLGGA